MDKEKYGWLKELLIATLIFITFFLVYLVRSHYDLALWDEGSNVYEVERVYNGQVPYRDFQALYAPGRFFIQALMFRIFGVTLATERGYMVLVIASLAAITYLLGRQLKINPWLCLWTTILVSHNSTGIFITPSIDRILSSFIAIGGMIVYDRTQKKVWLIGTGILCAMSILIAQETGLYTLVALTLFLCWRAALSRKNLKEKGLMLTKEFSLFSGGVFLGIIPFLAYIIFHNAMGDMIRDLLIDPLGEWGKTNPLSSFKEAVMYLGCLCRHNPMRLMVFLNRFLLTLIIPASALFFLLGRMGFYKDKIVREDGYLLMLGLFGGGLGMALTFLLNFNHILISLPPTYIMAMLFFEKAGKAILMSKSYKYKIVALVIVFYLGLHFLVTTRSTFNSYIGPLRRPCWELNLPRARILIPSQDIIGPDQQGFPFRNEKEIKELINHIQSVTPEGKSIFFVSHGGMLYFLADRDNPTRYDHVNQYVSPPYHQKRVIEDLENKGVEYVVLSNVPFTPNYTCKDEVRDFHPQLYNYIITHYRFEEKVGLHEFWKRINFK